MYLSCNTARLKKVTFRKNIASVIFRDVIKFFTKMFPKWKALFEFDQTLKQKFVYRDNYVKKGK